MTTIVHFLRHGEVENPNKIMYGRLPAIAPRRREDGQGGAVDGPTRLTTSCESGEREETAAPLAAHSARIEVDERLIREQKLLEGKRVAWRRALRDSTQRGCCDRRSVVGRKLVRLAADDGRPTPRGGAGHEASESSTSFEWTCAGTSTQRSGRPATARARWPESPGPLRRAPGRHRRQRAGGATGRPLPAPKRQGRVRRYLGGCGWCWSRCGGGGTSNASSGWTWPPADSKAVPASAANAEVGTCDLATTRPWVSTGGVVSAARAGRGEDWSARTRPPRTGREFLGVNTRGHARQRGGFSGTMDCPTRQSSTDREKWRSHQDLRGAADTMRRTAGPNRTVRYGAVSAQAEPIVTSCAEPRIARSWVAYPKRVDHELTSDGAIEGGRAGRGRRRKVARAGAPG